MIKPWSLTRASDVRNVEVVGFKSHHLNCWRKRRLEMRTGVHTGEVQLRDQDVAGLAVVIAHRVSALANAGELLVSSTVKDLVVGSSVQFEDRGLHELKGVPGTWGLYAVRE